MTKLSSKHLVILILVMCVTFVVQLLKPVSVSAVCTGVYTCCELWDITTDPPTCDPGHIDADNPCDDDNPSDCENPSCSIGDIIHNGCDWPGWSGCPSGQNFCGGCINACRDTSSQTCGQWIDQECDEDDDGGGDSPDGGSCTSSCGTCGFRTDAGVCETNNDCCHRECGCDSNTGAPRCTTKHGSGSNQCLNPDDCPSCNKHPASVIGSVMCGPTGSPLKNIDIQVRDTANVVVAQTKTDDNGSYITPAFTPDQYNTPTVSVRTGLSESLSGFNQSGIENICPTQHEDCSFDSLEGGVHGGFDFVSNQVAGNMQMACSVVSGQASGTFSWDEVAGATRYILRVDYDDGAWVSNNDYWTYVPSTPGGTPTVGSCDGSRCSATLSSNIGGGFQEGDYTDWSVQAIVGQQRHCITHAGPFQCVGTSCQGMSNQPSGISSLSSVGLNRSMTFDINATGTPITRTEICFHGIDAGVGPSVGWKCLRDSSPDDGSFPSTSVDNGNSSFSVGGSGAFTFNQIKTALTTGSNPHDPDLIDENGIAWGVNVSDSQGTCFSNGSYSGPKPNCRVEPSCSGAIQLDQDGPEGPLINASSSCNPSPNVTLAWNTISGVNPISDTWSVERCSDNLCSSKTVLASNSPLAPTNPTPCEGGGFCNSISNSIACDNESFCTWNGVYSFVDSSPTDAEPIYRVRGHNSSSNQDTQWTTTGAVAPICGSASCSVAFTNPPFVASRSLETGGPSKTVSTELNTGGARIASFNFSLDAGGENTVSLSPHYFDSDSGEYRADVSGIAEGSTTITVKVNMPGESNPPTCSDSQPIRVADAPTPAWWQAWGGHVYAGTTIKTTLPDQTDCTLLEPCVPAIIRNLLNPVDDIIPNSAGVPRTGAGVINNNPEGNTHPDRGTISEHDNQPFTNAPTKLKKQSYDFFRRKLELGSLPPINTNEISTLPNTGGQNNAENANVVYRDGDLTFKPNNTIDIPSTAKRVVMVNGNLTIDASDMPINTPLTTVDPGGFLAFIVNGNVTITQTVGHSPPTANISSLTPILTGVFVAEGDLVIESDNQDNTADLQFVGAGSFVGWGGVDLQRSLDDGAPGNTDNVTIPAETFIFRPDFVVNTPTFMLEPNRIWQEVAPGDY